MYFSKQDVKDEKWWKFDYHFKLISLQCAAGVAYETPCKRGLAYSPDYHLCDYPDNVPDCKGKSETVVGFKCPSPDELPPNAVARKFLPYPRFPLPGIRKGK